MLGLGNQNKWTALLYITSAIKKLLNVQNKTAHPLTHNGQLLNLRERIKTIFWLMDNYHYVHLVGNYHLFI